MRNILTIIVIAICAALIIPFQSTFIDFESKDENLVAQELKGENEIEEETISILPVHKDIQVMEGIGSWISKTDTELISSFGEPDRIDLSPYDYEWWVYNTSLEHYVQFGVSDGIIVTAYVIGEKVKNDPFVIGANYEEVNQKFAFESAINVDYDSGSYRFQLKDEDLITRPLLKIGDIFVQVYFDSFEQTLSSVRFLDKETLIKQRPYELVYRGTLIDPKSKTDEEWKLIEEGTALQIIDFTNIIRKRFELSPVDWHEETAQVAYLHSKDMNNNDYFSHSSPTEGTLSERLTKGNVSFLLAGENIAAKYVDGVAAVEGWLNSEGHRNTLLNENFTHLGVGVYEKYYTQNFIQTWKQ
ncbi:CAP domain-containing protein [Sutcliffiella cohnii]|uniref:CAP domain-containing protein n=1 Tax=Sutcliffiella cohnii TaxID=33932 RepID=UPI002E1B1806|nr:CAP domain-containing protein [Sutcliffiella cohnii]